MAVMRILACADLHGRPERIARVRTLVAEHAPAVVLLSGDLTHGGFGREALALLRILPVPVLAVPGNMDALFAAGEIRRYGGLAGAEPVVLQGISIAGPAVRRPVDILVVHEPPLGTLDLIASGRHVHESPGIARLDPTLVVNCTMGGGTTAGALIEITSDAVGARRL
jgi:Icc-related predicted phosphoesterase